MACPWCRDLAYMEARRCLTCGHHPADPQEKPEPAEGEDPVGDGPRRWACRYCRQEFESAAEVRAHQGKRHVGCGERLVTDVNER